MPGNDLHELIAWLRANPNKASAGIYSASGRLTAAIFQRETGTKFALVSYRGGPPAVQDLAAGQIDLFLAGTTIDLPLMRAGSIKAYAVSSGVRVALAPDIPTYAEMGLSAMSYSGWFGLFAPKRTPREIITKLNAAAVEALADPAVRARLIDFGLDILPHERHTPEALAAMQKADAEKFWPLIKEFGIKGE
jgi:tripartite-type tricarboxylate transporter receptor subunit TctC